MEKPLMVIQTCGILAKGFFNFSLKIFEGYDDKNMEHSIHT